MKETILGIHSNVTSGSKTGGHAWISITTNGAIVTYGLWPDEHQLTEDNGPGFDIRKNLELNSQASASRYYKLSESQAKKLWVEVYSNKTWKYRYNCSTWASYVVKQVIGRDMKARDMMLLGITSPRQLGQSILKLEASDPTSRSEPKDLSLEENRDFCSISFF